MERTAYGKINLGLRVLGKRPDGYHEVDMILQSISLADTITFTPAPGFSLETDQPDLPCDDSNLMVKAARAFTRPDHRLSPGLYQADFPGCRAGGRTHRCSGRAAGT